MITLRLDGQPLPLVLLTSTRYTLTVFFNGETPIFDRWTVYTSEETISTGTGDISVTFTQATTHYISVQVTQSNGLTATTVFTVQVVSNRSTPTEVGVVWDKLSFPADSRVSGHVAFRDPLGAEYRSLNWTLFRNGEAVSGSSTTTEFSYENAPFGVYRVLTTAVDQFGNVVQGDSSVRVTGEFETQASVRPSQPSTSLAYLGSVYTPRFHVGPSTITALPQALATFFTEEWLMPGTTFYKLELDFDGIPSFEVVVRTNGGNFSLVGPPEGLLDENVGYDYQPGQPFIPSPDDLRMKVGTEAFKVTGNTSSAFDFRVRIKCYRETANVYSYTPCDLSYFETPGYRNRRWAVIFTELDTQTDVDSALNRYGTGDSTISTTATNASSAFVRLDSDGAPDVIQKKLGDSYTAQNIITTYEPVSDTLPELDAHAIYGLEGVRPFCMTLIQPSDPPVSQRVKRLGGNAVVYLAGGVLNIGTVITLKVYTGRSFQTFGATVTSTVKSPDVDTYVRAATVAINLVDYQFTGGSGVVVDVTVNESSITNDVLPDCPNDPTPGPPIIYSTQNADALYIDGACYTNPVLVSAFTTGEILTGEVIEGCYDTRCGPQGLYCYTSTADGTTTIQVPQQLHFPADAVAFKSNLAECYANPVFNGSYTGLSPSAPIIELSGTGNCGRAYEYTSCDGSQTIGVVFPLSTSAHSAISYGSYCYSLVGTITSTPGYTFVDRTDVDPVADCGDVECTGSNQDGNSITYVDLNSGATVSVEFPQLNTGVAAWGVADRKIDSGVSTLPTGKAVVRLEKGTPEQTVLPNVTADGYLDFLFSGMLKNVDKKVVVRRGGADIDYTANAGSPFVRVAVASGDKVKINAAGTNNKMNRTVFGLVEWKPFVALPRIYDSSSMEFYDYPSITADNGSITADSGCVYADGWTCDAPAGISTINAVGFCGLTDRSDYSFYGTLPADVAMSYPNPDSVVTVQGENLVTEYALVRTRAIGDPTPSLPSGVEWYAGQELQSPLLFRFYASRYPQGAHGEMDVWVDTDQLWPNQLSLSPWEAVGLPQSFYRRDSLPEDTQRRSAEVTTTGTTFHYPYVYASDSGRKISLRISPVADYGTVTYSGTQFIQKEIDSGISYGAIALSDSSL